jgi:hypothetical protein
MTEQEVHLIPCPKDIDDETDAVIPKKRPGRPKNAVWDFFTELGPRVQGHCGAKCIQCGWEKKPMLSQRNLKTILVLNVLKLTIKLKKNI